MKLHEYPVIVIVWAQDGCEMCKEYVPRFRRVAEMYAGCVPAAVFDVETVDDAWLAHFHVHHVPTTMVVRYGRITARRDAFIDDTTIVHLFGLASIGQECQIP